MIYLDNSATTEISAAAKQKMLEAMDIYGNPSSTHKAGIEARKIIDEARERLGAALGVARPNPENLIFTSPPFLSFTLSPGLSCSELALFWQLTDRRGCLRTHLLC